MKALVTGASSGIGYSISKYLDNLGYELILVGRNKENLEKLQKELKNNSKIILCDLSDLNNCTKLYMEARDENIDILVNNAGFGIFGKFWETDINKELELINTNIKSLHLLTKLFLKDMKKRNYGYILNVASSAAFGPGPLMSTYYASKAYVEILSESINEELRREKSNVIISILCPGPVNTNFNKVAGVNFSVKPLEADYVAEYAIKKLLKGKCIIVPGFSMRLVLFLRRFSSRSLARKLTYNIQHKKEQ